MYFLEGFANSVQVVCVELQWKYWWNPLEDHGVALRGDPTR